MNPADPQRILRRMHELFLQRLAQTARPSAERLTAAWRRILPGLNRQLAELQAVARAHEAEGRTARALYADRALTRLRNSVEESVKALENAILKEAQGLERLGVQAGVTQGAANMRLAGVTGAFNQPSVESINALISVVDSPAWRQTLEGMAGYEREHVADMVLSGMAQGKNPVTVARLITRYVVQMPLVRAIAMTRTTQLYAARAGTLQIYRANPDLVRGWIWVSAADGRTCPGCWAMHGTKHTLDETLNDHHRGRCAMAPLTASFADLGFDVAEPVREDMRGEAIFKTLPKQEQRAILGPGRYEAWSRGAVQFEQFTTTYQHPVYGEMRRAANLGEIGK